MAYVKKMHATDSETELLVMKDGFSSHHAKVGSIKSLSVVYLVIKIMVERCHCTLGELTLKVSCQRRNLR